jgi:hypothetical protein
MSKTHSCHPTAAAIIGRVRFVDESRGDPLGSFPSISLAGSPYNLWLTGQILDPMLRRWGSGDLVRDRAAAALAHDVEWASGRSRLGFQEILPAAASLGDPAVLAAMSVTANLQRTLALLAEIILDGAPSGFSVKEGAGDLPGLSRLWCGFIDYPDRAPYFPGRVRAPVHAARLHPGRRDPRHLANALWCSIGEINAHCDEALSVLRRKIIQSGLFGPDDLRHLHADAIQARGRR